MRKCEVKKPETAYIEKSSGKGGWTYTIIPEIPMGKAFFDMLKVKGSIDGFEIGKYHLIPSGKVTLFLSVKHEIRKKIKKQAGDYVHVILYPHKKKIFLNNI